MLWNEIYTVLTVLLYAFLGTILLCCLIDRIRDTAIAIIISKADAQARVIQAQSDAERALFANEDEDSDEETTVYQRPCRVRRIHDEV